MILKQLYDDTQYDLFVKNHPYCHYMKTTAWAKFKVATDKQYHYSYRLIGFFENDKMIGSAMLLSGRWFNHSFIYIPKGPCIDYASPAVYKEAFTLLKEYADQNKVLFLRVDPNVIRVPHDIKGNVLDGFNNEFVTEDLKELGYAHKGYGYAYDGSWSNRYTLIVDLSPDMADIEKSYNKSRKAVLKRHKTEHVSTRLGTAEDIPTLMAFESQLAEQDGFEPHSYEFFKILLDVFNENAVMYVTSINLKDMAEHIETELASNKYKHDLEAKQSKEKKLVYAKELQERYGNCIDIAAGLFVKCGDMSFDLYTYNHKEFGFISAVDNLHRFAMEDMKKRGVLHYDMCGFSGVTTEDDPEFGLYAYKASFGPEYIEMIGEFDYARNANKMKRFRYEKLIANHIKRKIWARKYKKK